MFYRGGSKSPQFGVVFRPPCSLLDALCFRNEAISRKSKTSACRSTTDLRYDEYSSPIPLLIFTGGRRKKCEIWPQIAFQALCFLNEATYLKPNITPCSICDVLTRPQILYSSIHPTLRKLGYEIPPPHKKLAGENVSNFPARARQK